MKADNMETLVRDILSLAEDLPATEERAPYQTRRQDIPALAGKAADSTHFLGKSDSDRVPRPEDTAAAATRESFWSLLSRGYTIVIPALQRDYAHGRPDRMAAKVRCRLLEDIFGCFRAEAGTAVLDLGFLYGSVDAEGRFIPLDGRQRLTTLFLLHWLLALRCGRLDTDPGVRDSLLRFLHEGRPAVDRFCRDLVLHARQDVLAGPDELSLSERIHRCSWFSDEAQKDPTVQAMLLMLDALDAQLAAVIADGYTPEALFSLLISGACPICFQFLDLGDAGLSDSIYIKMNARGRPLTFFESFKAMLPSFLGASFSASFLRKVNSSWAAFFWKAEYRPSGPNPVTDLPMLRFFRFMILTDYIASVETSAGKNAVCNAVTILLKESDEAFFSRLFRDSFRHVGDLKAQKAPVTMQTFLRIQRLLDTLVVRKQKTGSVAFLPQAGRWARLMDEEALFRRLIGSDALSLLSYEELILLSAEYRFLLLHAHPDGSFCHSFALARWIRLVKNLTASILNLQPDVFFEIVRAGSPLVENGFALHCTRGLLSWPKLPEPLQVFPVSQLREEALKASLMRNHFLWKRAILDAEASFLGGRLDALFAFSGIRAEDYLSRCGQPDDAEPGDAVTPLPSSERSDSGEYLAFMRYFRRFSLLFDRSGVRPELEEAALLRRALLCFGGEDSFLLPPGKPRQCFLDSTDRDVGFRRLLWDACGGRRDALRQLLDALDESCPVQPQLHAIINRTLFHGEERWKEYLVTMPEILSSVRTSGAACLDPMHEWVFQTDQRFIRRNSADDILLLSRTQTSSVSREYYSYVLFLKARQLGMPVYYHADYTESSEKYAWFVSHTGEQIRLLYCSRGGADWCYRAQTAEDCRHLCKGSLEEMLEYIRELV